MKVKYAGKMKPIVTREFLVRLRETIKEFAPGTPFKEIGKQIHKDFSEVSRHTLCSYVSSVTKSSDLVFKLLTDGKLTINEFMEITQGSLDHATQEILAMNVCKRMVRKRSGRLEKMGAKNVCTFKKVLAEGKGKISVADALSIACGEMPGHAKPEDVKKCERSFGGILGELLDASNTFMAKLDMAIEVLPASTLNSGENQIDLFQKLTVFANALETSHRFVVERRKRFLAAYRAHVVTEAAMDQRRKLGEA